MSAQAITDASGTRRRQGGGVAEMQRRRLLLALGELVGEAGVEGASVGRVCKRAGVSRRTFYDLFDDREDCLLAALDQAIERLDQVVRASAAGAGSWREQVRLALSALLAYLDEQPGVARLCVVETLRAGPVVLERRRAVLERLAAAIDQGRAQGRAEPPPLTAESTIGGAVAVVHARIVAGAGGAPLLDLTGPLMSMIVHPYLGPAAAQQELGRASDPPTRTAPRRGGPARPSPMPPTDAFKDLRIRVTFRTVRVLAEVAARPGASNREIGRAAGVADQGQMSKLLHRLQDAALIENGGDGQPRGERNAWTLTPRGHGLLSAIGDGAGAA